MSIEVANESGTEVDEAQLVSVARFALDRMRVHPGAELSMVLVDTPVMAELHEQWMDLPGATDVMAFPMDEIHPGGRPDAAQPGPAMLGDVILCPPFVVEQARAAGHTVADELHLLTVHGVLHLLGYDHAEPDEKKVMFDLQDDLLGAWRDREHRAARRVAQDDADLRVLDAVGLGPEPGPGSGSGSGPDDEGSGPPDVGREPVRP